MNDDLLLKLMMIMHKQESRIMQFQNSAEGLGIEITGLDIGNISDFFADVVGLPNDNTENISIDSPEYFCRDFICSDWFELINIKSPKLSDFNSYLDSMKITLINISDNKGKS